MASTVQPLSQLLAEERAAELGELIELVDPSVQGVDYLFSDEGQNGAHLLGKWDHSILVEEEGHATGVALAYERSADPSGLSLVNNRNSLHLGILAVRVPEQGRGIGSMMIKHIVDSCTERGFLYLPGKLAYIGLTVADDKPGPRRLYESFGLSVIGSESRNGKIYHAMRAPIDEVLRSSRYLTTKVFS